MSLRRTVSTATLAAALLGLSACATPHPQAYAPALRDPYEKFNRSMYGINRGLDKGIVTPAAKAYRFAVPVVARRGITNIFNNLEEPLSFINAMLQGKPKRAWHALKRFAINTTIGVGGLADHATGMGIPAEPEDFGQTLAVWGVKSGPYLMLPFLGPSSFRDGVGFGVDTVSDPITYARNAAFHPSFAAKAGIFVVQTLDLRSKLIDAGADSVLEGSLDEYATVRSAYLQRRTSEIFDGNPPDEDEDAPIADAPLAPGATPPARATPGTPPPVAPAPPAVTEAPPEPPKP